MIKADANKNKLKQEVHMEGKIPDLLTEAGTILAMIVDQFAKKTKIPNDACLQMINKLAQLQLNILNGTPDSLGDSDGDKPVVQ